MLRKYSIDIVSSTKIIVGLLLIVASLVFLHQQPRTATAQSPSDFDYKTTWTATKLITLNTPKFVDPKLKIALGPAEWSVVVADKNGTPVYKEDWQSPLPATGIQVTNHNNVPSTYVGLDPTKWLFSTNVLSVSWNAYPNVFNYQAEDVASLNLGSVVRVQNQWWKSGNGGYTDGAGHQQSLSIACGTDGVWCLYPTGGYGWQAEIIDTTSDSTPGMTGILMPLQWTVYGKKF